MPDVRLVIWMYKERMRQKVTLPVRCNKLISSDHNNLDDNYWFKQKSRTGLDELWRVGSCWQKLLSEIGRQAQLSNYIDGIRASMDYYNIDEAKKQAILTD